MDRTDVVIVLFAVLTLALVAWAQPLDDMPFWLVVVLSVVFYPVGRELLPAVGPAVGSGSTWAAWTLTVSANVAFITVVELAVRGCKSFRGAYAGRQLQDQDVDA